MDAAVVESLERLGYRSNPGLTSQRLETVFVSCLASTDTIFLNRGKTKQRNERDRLRHFMLCQRHSGVFISRHDDIIANLNVLLSVL